jgi:hypothetical protein
VTTALFSSPGPDASELSPAVVRSLPPAPMMTTSVTPAPAPTPAPGTSWVEQQLQALKDAVTTGRSTFEQAEAEGRALRNQVQTLDLAGSINATLTDVRHAAQLKQMLPFVILAVGFLVGRPLIGIGAAVVVWAVGQQE